MVFLRADCQLRNVPGLDIDLLEDIPERAVEDQLYRKTLVVPTLGKEFPVR
jgi:hypothetical protein